MEAKNLPEPIRECLATHEAFRRLGFLADDIFVRLGMEGVTVELRAQGLEFIIDVNDDGWDVDTAGRHMRWAEAVDAWNISMTEDERRMIWQESDIASRSVEMVVKLLDKGFKFPTVTPVAALKSPRKGR